MSRHRRTLGLATERVSRNTPPSCCGCKQLAHLPRHDGSFQHKRTLVNSAKKFLDAEARRKPRRSAECLSPQEMAWSNDQPVVIAKPYSAADGRTVSVDVFAGHVAAALSGPVLASPPSFGLGLALASGFVHDWATSISMSTHEATAVCSALPPDHTSTNLCLIRPPSLSL